MNFSRTASLQGCRDLERLRQEGNCLLPDCISPTFDEKFRGRRGPWRQGFHPSAPENGFAPRRGKFLVAGIFKAPTAPRRHGNTTFCSAAAEPEFAERRGKQHGAQWGWRGEFRTSEIFSTFRSFWPFIIFRRDEEGNDKPRRGKKSPTTMIEGDEAR